MARAATTAGGNGDCVIPLVGVSVAERVLVMRRVLTDALISACALAVLLVALVAMDGRVREELTSRMDGARASTEIAAGGNQARKLGSVVAQVVKEQSRENGPQMI